MAKKKAAATSKTAAKSAPKKTGKTTKKTSAGKPAAKAKKPAAKVSKAKTKPGKKTTGAKEQKPLRKQAAKPVKAKDATDLLADAIVEGILEVKGKYISVLNLKDIHNRVCDFFIICQADSNTQVNAIANSIEEIVKKRTGERPYRKEGFENSEWILVDYVTVVAHIFQTEVRNFYNLESLWADAEVTEIAFD
ncbi:MAG: ribosome silencing factor [Bacteroidia bacterium]